MKWIITALAILSLFLFVGDPDNSDNRVVKEIWGLGHFVLFAGIIFVLLEQKITKSYSFAKKVALAVVSCVSLGFATESIQLLVDRNFEFKDIVNDVIGGLTGLLLHYLFRTKIILKRVLLSLVVVLCSIASGKDLIATGVDEFNIRQGYPTLADFESTFELVRWDYSDASLLLSGEHKKQGEHALKIDFTGHQNPRVSLESFIRNWEGYSKIQFSLYNPANRTVQVEFKIYDKEHRANHFEFSDRFNDLLTLKHGWNDFTIPFEAIKNAPANRLMALDDIASMSWFVKDQPLPVTIFLDDLKLVI